MENSTNTCRQGVGWCEQHEVLDAVDDAGQPIERHIAWLWYRYAPIQPRMPSTALYVSTTSFHSTGPGIALQQFNNPPQPISPEEARSLSAALLRGAEIVEAAQTATCPSCGRAATPEDLAYSADLTAGDKGDCGECRHRRWSEHLDRRAAMKVVQPIEYGADR